MALSWCSHYVEASSAGTSVFGTGFAEKEPRLASSTRRTVWASRGECGMT
jgi:hypothetical protein